jgi:hypothetical protein
MCHLDHDVIRVDRFADLVDPAFHDLGSLLHQMERGDESSARHTRRLVNNGLLHVSFNTLEHSVVGDSAKSPDGWPSVQILFARHVFGERAGHNDHVIGYCSHFFDTQVEHASEENVFGLEQLGHGEECGCCFCRSQMFTLIKLFKIF